MLTHQITCSLPERVFQEINNYQLSTHKQSFEEALTELLQYALTSLPPYFQKFDWKKAEREADQDIQDGRTQTFDTLENFLADLKQ